ncbi:MAG: ATP-binding protein [Syntrophobacteraceae bacterium]
MQNEPDPTESSSSADVAFRRKLQGLLLFRLILAVFFLLLTLIVQLRREGECLSAHLQPLYLFSCVLFVFTIIAALSLRRLRSLKAFAYVQLFFDVAAVTFLIFLSGGIDSPFSFLYMPVIISAAVLLYRRGSVFTASVCSLSYGLLLDLQYFRWISPLQIVAERSSVKDSGAYLYSIIMGIAGFYLVAYLSGYLAEELQKSSIEIRIQKRDLHRLEILHSNIVQSMNSGLLTVSPNGLIVFSNAAAEVILGLPVEQLRKEAFQKIFPSLDPLTWPSSNNDQALKPAELLSRKELDYRRHSGEELCLGYTVSVLQKDEEANAGWVFIFQDLTHLKAMEEHLRRTERVALAGRIAAEIAHEIKNPLAAMSGAIQMLQDEISDNPMRSKLMNIVQREIHRINDLVTDFLWLSRGGVRKVGNVDEISACVAIQDVLQLLEAQEKINSRQRITTKFECMPVLSIDPRHFHQILWNLIVNALEAMPEGGELAIKVGLSDREAVDKEEVRIDISDTGCGIPEEKSDKIFEPFYTTKQNGTGLGLSIVYQLMENAGGRIKVNRDNGPGATFSLYFPFISLFPLAN